ncbi:GDP-fucose transporter 1, putative [Eimeria tenella]|uniref:GDP-fucose transporter 1, putative n=1 Tax=Eimeria tenella TaxID=5802 RepID=U6KVF1_EIMTE|nr:GDP-fucose transporter 1, putative [Eimeria tenella]CDJ42112.1 GDP-fucose transporter 1, putative [Eimeria tenella]|eukprot:XP_013232862.1 GDP-fucose transporter 1, putative [Eimeria tenella]
MPTATSKHDLELPSRATSSDISARALETVESHSSGRLGRRLSSKCFSPTYSDSSEAGSREQTPGAASNHNSSTGGPQRDASPFEEKAKSPSSSIAHGDDCTPQSSDACPGAASTGPSFAVRAGRACGALGSYVMLSILTVFWTKHLVGGQVPTPLFLSWVQQGVGLALYSAVSAVVAILCSQRTVVGRAFIAAFPVVRIRAKVMLNVLPLSVCFVGMIGSANLCLQRVQVSVYQVARSLTLVFSLLLSVFWLKQKVVRAEVFSCLFVAMGFALMTAVGSDTASVTGYIMGALASLFQATYTVQMKATLVFIEKESDTLLPAAKPRSAYRPITNENAATAQAYSDVTGLDPNPDSQDSDGGIFSKPRSATIDMKLPAELRDMAETNWDYEAALQEGQEEGQQPKDDDLELFQEGQQRHSRPMRLQNLAEREGLPTINGGAAKSSAGLREAETRDSPPPPLSPVERPRAEPLCMFYNMLNALCLFPIVVLVSEEPKVLWKLAAEGSMMSGTVLAQVVGLGKAAAGAWRNLMTKQ